MSGWIGYVIAVGVSALICLALMVRAERRNRQRGLPSDGGSEPYGDSGGYLWSQFGSHHSAHNHCGHLDGGGSGGGVVMVVGATAAAVFDDSGRKNQRLDRSTPKTLWMHPSVNPNSVWNHFK